MSINLFHSVAGPEAGGESPDVVLLHGLFGMGNNLGALSRALKDVFRVYSLDLPNHGRSDWMANADVPGMARCVSDWMDGHKLLRAHFFGHSLGGKVAMSLALEQPDKVGSLCIADIAPVAYPPRHDNVLNALQAVIDARCKSREEAAAIMAQYLGEDTLVQFLLMSIRRGDQGIYRWRFNLAEIVENYAAIRAGLEADKPYTSDALFIKGGESDYILTEHREQILRLFPNATVKLMPGCGHWLHAQKPRLFNSIVRRFLLGQAG